MYKVVDILFEKDYKKKKKLRKNIPLSSFFFTLSSAYKVGTSVPARWHKQNILRD